MTARDVARFALGFVREHTPESSARLVGLLCGITGCTVAAATTVFAYHHPDNAASISALAATTTALIGGGAAAIFARSRTGGEAEP